MVGQRLNVPVFQRAARRVHQVMMRRAAAFSIAKQPELRGYIGRRLACDERIGRIAAIVAAVAGGDPERKIAACNRCHDGRNPAYPLIAGQSPAYIAAQLRLFRDGKRGGTAHHDLMHAASRMLEDRDIEVLADYFGG